MPADNLSESSKPEEKSEQPQASLDHPMFESVKKCEDDLESVRHFFEVEGVPLNLEDSSGMTPLMHACWKGHIKLAKFLINLGADVNSGNHEHDYTSLHFAALAGKANICKLLLQNGVRIDRTNSVKRTAAQMAAFVGNHECVSVINNFVPLEDVYYFTKKQPFEDEAKLSVPMAKSIHNLVMSMNTHPVKVAMILKADANLLQNLGKVCQILELMSDREFKNRRDVNEVLSLKYHILHYIVKDIKKQMDKSKSLDTKTPLIDLWIKSMLVGRDSDGYPVFQEDFLRQGVKEFPYPESQLFKMLVTNFSHCKNYGDGVSAAEYINSAFNGQKGFKDEENCDTCASEGAKKKCSNCQSVQYCDQTCQKFHWFVHKKFCPILKEKVELQQKDLKVSEEKLKEEMNFSDSSS